jgi:hypothetical protein
MRFGTALATLEASPGHSSDASPGARSSAATTPKGNKLANVAESLAGLAAAEPGTLDNCESIGTFARVSFAKASQ